MAINGLTVICYAARPLNIPRLILIVSMAAALLMAVITQGTLFSMVALSFPAWLVLIVLALLVVPIQMAFERVFDRCSALLEARRQRRKGARQTFRDQRREQ